jgi:hypothetical protein
MIGQNVSLDASSNEAGSASGQESLNLKKRWRGNFMQQKSAVDTVSKESISTLEHLLPWVPVGKAPGNLAHHRRVSI